MLVNKDMKKALRVLLDHSRQLHQPNCVECERDGICRESDHTCQACEEVYCHTHWGESSSICDYCMPVGLTDPD